MTRWPWTGRRAAALSEEFSRRLGGWSSAPAAGRLFGLELEYAVRRRPDGRPVDFGDLVHEIGPSQRGLDPIDPQAYRLESGAVLTADESEAEVALPPVVTRPGFAHSLDRSAMECRGWLARRLGPGYDLAGVSSHLSIAVPDDALDPTAGEYARRWAMALMLLLDDASSPGLLVRPRPDRLELGGEYSTGADLRAAAVFALASALACLAFTRSPPREGLPGLRLALRMADQRFGWYVDRRAAGPDLYIDGRSTRLVTDDGRSRTAQEHLEQAWSLARPFLAGHVRPPEVDAVDRLVAARDPLRIEREQGAALPEHRGPAPEQDAPAGAARLPSAEVRFSAYARALAPRRRPACDLAPVMLTWQVAVFVVASNQQKRRAFAVVPARLLGRFLARLEQGRLDDVLAAYLGGAPADRRLARPEQAAHAGLYDTIALRAGLLPPERSLVRPGAIIHSGTERLDSISRLAPTGLRSSTRNR